ncbi:MAG: spore germination protein GerW family protein [Armatimonadota bacterium]
MDVTQIRDLLGQLQAGARVTTAVGEPVQVGNRVVLPVAEVSYGGGGGGGMGRMPARDGEPQTGGGGGGGGGISVRPIGCWVIGPDDERWLPAVDVNRGMLICGSIAMLGLLILKILVVKKRR